MRRSAIHSTIQATSTAWHACAQSVCNLVASVTADMHEINESLSGSLSAGHGAPGASTRQDLEPHQAPNRAKFLALSGVLAAIAAVMHRYPSPSYALASERIGQQLHLLASFSHTCLSGPPTPLRQVPRPAAPVATTAAAESRAATAPPGLPATVLTCTQHAAVWLGLLQRAAQPRAIANVLEASCKLAGVSMHSLIPSRVPPSWLQVHQTAAASGDDAQPSEESSRAMAVTSPSPDIAAVEDLVHEAFQNVLKHAVAEDEPSHAAAAATPGVSEQPTVSVQGSRATGGALPLWLVLLVHVSLLLNIDCVSCSGQSMVPEDSEVPMHGGSSTTPGGPGLTRDSGARAPDTALLLKHLVVVRSAARPAAWGLLSVLVPLLEPIAPFCTPVKVLEVEASAEGPPLCGAGMGGTASELSWAAQLWRMHLSMSRAVLDRAEAGNAEASRGIAGFVLNLVTHRAGQVATRSVCGYLMRALYRCSALDAPLNTAGSILGRPETAADAAAEVSNPPGHGYRGSESGAGPTHSDSSQHSAPSGGRGESRRRERGRRGKRQNTQQASSSGGESVASGAEHARFQFVFGVHLLQTALRRQQVPVSAVLALVEEVGGMVHRVCGVGGTMHAPDSGPMHGGPTPSGKDCGDVADADAPDAHVGKEDRGSEQSSAAERAGIVTENEPLDGPKSHRSVVLSVDDRLQVLGIAMSSVSLAMQTPLATQQRMHAHATTVLASSAILLSDALHALQTEASAQTSSHVVLPCHVAASHSVGDAEKRTPVATNSGAAAPASASPSLSASRVQTLCSMLQQLLPTVASVSPAAVQLLSLCVGAVVCTACALPGTPTLDIALPSTSAATKDKENVASPRGSASAPAATEPAQRSGVGGAGAVLMSAAEGLLAAMVGGAASCAPQHMHAVLLCFASLSVPASAHRHFEAILQRVAAWHVSHKRGDHECVSQGGTGGASFQGGSAASGMSSMHVARNAGLHGTPHITLEAAKAAVARYASSQRAVLLRSTQHIEVPVAVSTALLEAVVRGGATARKVLVAPGALFSQLHLHF